ncbi:alpha/beta fold hydrolase [Nocardia wallacei]|uniref:alpha/beta fold hydrolase n=1 Tax=Nocardia wallacei TaxID=480035 RepID=UPI0024585402|nr:alpha/beta fold hydrolase [Nocardia wallacei]
MTREPGRRSFDLGEVRLEALTWGEAGGDLALCLHGYPDTAWTWRHLAPELAGAGYYVVAPFLRGYGPSSIPSDRDVSVGALVADALDVTSRVGAPDAVLIGHDWGAITANTIATLDDSPFRGIVSLAVPPLACVTPQRRTAARQVPQILAQTAHSWYILVNQLPILPEQIFDRMVAFLWKTWSPGYDATTDLRHLAQSARTADNRHAIIDYYRRLVRPGTTSSRHAAFQRQLMSPPRQPTLQLHGLSDGCLRPQLYTGVGARLPMGSRLVPVSHAGHFLHLEQPTTVASTITDYIGPADSRA